MAQEEATGIENISDFGENIGKREAAKLCKRRNLAMKNEERLRVRKIREILRKEVNKRTSDDVNYLCRYPKVVTELVRRNEKRRQLMERKKEVSYLIRTISYPLCLWFSKFLQKTLFTP